MKIAAAEVVLQAQHLVSQHEEHTESLRTWSGERRPPAPPVPAADERSDEGSAQTRISDAARELLGRLDFPPVLAADAGRGTEAAALAADPADPAAGDPTLSLIRSMVEIITGRPVRVFAAAQMLASPNAVQGPVAADAGSAPSPAGAGFGAEYRRHSVYEENEQTSVAAQGVVKTADGREIDFTLALQMNRSYREERSTEILLGNAVRKDPLVLNFGAPAAQLSNQRFLFDLDADGRQEALPTLGGGSGYLVFDLNMNGRIDDGRELFGPATGSGFAELARLDDDGNGWIDEADAAYAHLQVWQPGADGETLATLSRMGIGAVYLGHTASPFELRGRNNEDLGAVRETGVFLKEDGQVRSIQEIDLTI